MTLVLRTCKILQRDWNMESERVYKKMFDIFIPFNLYNYQVVHAKVNLQFSYPPQYYREIWHYKDANIELIRQVIDGFNWQKTIFNKIVNEKVDS